MTRWCRVTTHAWMRHGTLMNESWHTRKWVTTHTWIRHVLWDTVHWWMSHFVCHDSFACVSWLIRVCVIMCVSWLIHECVMTHSCVCHDLFTCVFWLIRVCVMTHSCVRHDSFVRLGKSKETLRLTCETWLSPWVHESMETLRSTCETWLNLSINTCETLLIPLANRMLHCMHKKRLIFVCRDSFVRGDITHSCWWRPRAILFLAQTQRPLTNRRQIRELLTANIL